MFRGGEKAAMGEVREISSSPSAEYGVPPTAKSSSGSAIKRHLRRFWWLHLIIFIICTLIIVLCLIFVAAPRISQNDINKSTLAVNSLVLTNPSPTSFHLLQNSTVENLSSYHPQLDAFNASLSLDGQPPYAYVEIPHIHATRDAISMVDQDVTITDAEAFSAYNVAVLNQEEVKVDVKGHTGLHEMRFPKTTVTYDKTTTMKGLNKLSGFNVTSFSIKLTPDPDGTNMVGEVYIPNPSVMTLTMGNVTFENILPATSTTPATNIGNTTLNNLVLTPGNNTIPMRSIINQTIVIEALATTYKDGMLPVDIVGTQAVYNGQHLPYFEKALQSLTQHISLDVGSALKAIGVDPSALAGLGGGSAPPS